MSYLIDPMTGAKKYTGPTMEDRRSSIARLGQQAFQQSQKNTNDTVGNGFFGHLVDAAQANAAGLFAGQLRAVDEGLNWAGEKLGLAEKTGTRDKSGWLEQAAQAMDEVQRRNTAQEELTGLNYLAQQVGSVLGSMAAMTGETAVAAAAIGAAVPALGAAAAGAGTVASAARLAGIASRLNKFANAAKTASLMPKTGKAIDAARKMWGSGYLQNYYKLQMMNSPAEALGQAGNLLKQLEDEGYDRDTIRAAALWSGTLNAAFLPLANMAEGKLASLGAKAIASNPATPEALKNILKPTMLGIGATLGKAARTSAWQGLTEGGEEATQDYIDQFATQVAQGKNFGDMTWDHATAAKSFVDAAVGSAGLGLLGGATNYRSRAKNFNANGHNFRLSDDGRFWSVDGENTTMKPAFNEDGTPAIDTETGEHIQTPQPYTAKEIADLMGNNITESDVRGAMREDESQQATPSGSDAGARPVATTTPETPETQKPSPGYTVNEDGNGNVVSYVDNISGVEYRAEDGWVVPVEGSNDGTTLYNIHTGHLANANGSEAAAAAARGAEGATATGADKTNSGETKQETPRQKVNLDTLTAGWTPKQGSAPNPKPAADNKAGKHTKGKNGNAPKTKPSKPADKPADKPAAPTPEPVVDDKTGEPPNGKQAGAPTPSKNQEIKLGVARALVDSKHISRAEHQSIVKYINEHPDDNRNMDVIIKEVLDRNFEMPSADTIDNGVQKVKEKQVEKKVGSGTTIVGEDGRVIHTYRSNTADKIKTALDKLKNDLYDTEFITNDEYEKAIKVIYDKHGKNIQWSKMLSAIRGKSFTYPSADKIAERRTEIENRKKETVNAETVNAKPEEVKVEVPKNDNQGKPEVGEGSKSKEKKVKPKPKRKGYTAEEFIEAIYDLLDSGRYDSDLMDDDIVNFYKGLNQEDKKKFLGLFKEHIVAGNEDGWAEVLNKMGVPVTKEEPKTKSKKKKDKKPEQKVIVKQDDPAPTRVQQEMLDKVDEDDTEVFGESDGEVELGALRKELPKEETKATAKKEEAKPEVKPKLITNYKPSQKTSETEAEQESVSIDDFVDSMFESYNNDGKIDKVALANYYNGLSQDDRSEFLISLKKQLIDDAAASVLSISDGKSDTAGLPLKEQLVDLVDAIYNAAEDMGLPEQFYGYLSNITSRSSIWSYLKDNDGGEIDRDEIDFNKKKLSQLLEDIVVPAEQETKAVEQQPTADEAEKKKLAEEIVVKYRQFVAKAKGLCNNFYYQWKKYMGLEIDGLAALTQYMDKGNKEVVATALREIFDALNDFVNAANVYEHDEGGPSVDALVGLSKEELEKKYKEAEKLYTEKLLRFETDIKQKLSDKVMSAVEKLRSIHTGDVNDLDAIRTRCDNIEYNVFKVFDMPKPNSITTQENITEETKGNKPLKEEPKDEYGMSVYDYDNFVDAKITEPAEELINNLPTEEARLYKRKLLKLLEKLDQHIHQHYNGVPLKTFAKMLVSKIGVGDKGINYDQSFSRDAAKALWSKAVASVAADVDQDSRGEVVTLDETFKHLIQYFDYLVDKYNQNPQTTDEKQKRKTKGDNEQAQEITSARESLLRSFIDGSLKTLADAVGLKTPIDVSEESIQKLIHELNKTKYNNIIKKQKEKGFAKLFGSDKSFGFLDVLNEVCPEVLDNTVIKTETVQKTFKTKDDTGKIVEVKRDAEKNTTLRNFYAGNPEDVKVRLLLGANDRDIEALKQKADEDIAKAKADVEEGKKTEEEFLQTKKEIETTLSKKIKEAKAQQAQDRKDYGMSSMLVRMTQRLINKITGGNAKYKTHIRDKYNNLILNDLEEAAVVGTSEAAARFNASGVESDATFETFVRSKVTNAILNYLTGSKDYGRSPQDEVAISKLKKAENTLLQHGLTRPSNEEIADLMNLRNGITTNFAIDSLPKQQEEVIRFAKSESKNDTEFEQKKKDIEEGFKLRKAEIETVFATLKEEIQQDLSGAEQDGTETKQTTKSKPVTPEQVTVWKAMSLDAAGRSDVNFLEERGDDDMSDGNEWDLGGFASSLDSDTTTYEDTSPDEDYSDRASIVKRTEQDTEVRNRILTPENEKKIVSQLQQLFRGYSLKNLAPHVYEVTLPNNNKLHIDMTSTSVQLIDKLGNKIGSLMDIAGLQGNIAVAGLYSADKGINLIRLTDAVRDGTVPHEVAHFVFNAVFNETERRKILDYYKSKIADKTGLTEEQLNRRAEEMFCDDFAEYFLNNKSEPKSKLQRMFEKMKRFLRKLVDMFSFKDHPYTEGELDLRRDDVDVNAESLAALFGRIANGDIYSRFDAIKNIPEVEQKVLIRALMNATGYTEEECTYLVHSSPVWWNGKFDLAGHARTTGEHHHGYGNYFAVYDIDKEGVITTSRRVYNKGRAVLSQPHFVDKNGNEIKTVNPSDIPAWLVKVLTNRVHEINEDGKHAAEVDQFIDSAINGYARNVGFSAREPLKLLKNAGVDFAKSFGGMTILAKGPSRSKLIFERVNNIDEQPEYVRKILNTINSDFAKQARDRGVFLIRDYTTLSQVVGSDKEASLVLKRYGIPGLQTDYRRDGAIIVLFDDNASEIVERFQLVSEGQANNISASAKAVQKAKEMYAKGASVTEVWKKTGCVRYNDGTVKLYVPFSNKDIRGAGLPKDFDVLSLPIEKFNYNGNPIRARVATVNLTDILTENNKFLALVPSLKRTKVTYIIPVEEDYNKTGNTAGYFVLSNNAIYLRVPYYFMLDDENIRQTLAHELQHAIQYGSYGDDRDALLGGFYNYDTKPLEKEARYAAATFKAENLAAMPIPARGESYDSFKSEADYYIRKIDNDRVFFFAPALRTKVKEALRSMADAHKKNNSSPVADVSYLEHSIMSLYNKAYHSGPFSDDELARFIEIYNGLRDMSRKYRRKQAELLQTKGRLSLPATHMIGEDTDGYSSTPMFQAAQVDRISSDGHVIGIICNQIPTLDGKPTTDEIGGAIVNADNKVLKKLSKVAPELQSKDPIVFDPNATGDENNRFSLLDWLRSPSRLAKKFRKVFEFFAKTFDTAYQEQNKLRYNWHNMLKEATDILGNSVESFNLFNDLMLYGDSYGRVNDHGEYENTGIDFDANQLNGMVYYTDAEGKKVFVPSDQQFIPEGVELHQLPENVAKAYLKVRELTETIYAAVDRARRSGLIKTEKANLQRILRINDPKNRAEGYVEIKGSDGQYHSLDEFRQYLNDTDTYDIRYAKIRVVDKNAAEVGVTQERLDQIRNDDTLEVISSTHKPETNGLYNVVYTKYMPHMGHRRGHVPHIFEQWMVAYVNDDGKTYTIQDSQKTVNAARESITKLQDDDASKGITRQYVIFPKAFDFGSFVGADEVSGGGALATQKQKQEMYVNLIKNYMMTPEEANQAVNAAMRTSVKNRIYGQAIQRKGVAGFSKDVMDALIREVTAASRYCALQPAKHAAIERYEHLFGMNYNADIKVGDNPLQAMVKSYIDDCNGKPSKAEQLLNRTLNNWNWYRNNISATYGDRAILKATSTANTIVSMAKLGFWNISSAVVNLFQNMNTIALCGFDHFGEGVKAFRDLKFKDKDKLTGKELADYLLNEQIIEQTGVKYDIGMDSATGYSMRLKRINNKTDVGTPKGLLQAIYDNYMRIGDKGLTLFSEAEAANRQICVLTAYRDGIARGMSHEEAIEYARDVNKKANFDYGVADTPAFMRAMSGTGVGEMMLLFQKYPVKELELMCEMCKKALSSSKDDKNQAARFWGMYFLMSGIGGIPFLDGFDEWLEHLFGYKPSKRAKLELIDTFGDNAFTRSVCYGVGAAAGIDISQRVGMGDMKFGNDQMMFPFNFGGAAGSTLKQMIEAAMEGNTTHFAKAFSPSFGAILESVWDGYSTDKKGRLRTLYSVPQRFVRGAGFRPIEDSVNADLNTALTEQRSDDRSEKSKFKYQIALKQTQGQQLTAEDQEKLRRMGITGKQLSEARKQIKQSFSKRAKEMMSKEQRQRYGTVYEELEAEEDAI